MASAQTTAQKELFLSKLQDKAEEFGLGGLSSERSQFLTESKYKEIVECLAEWESRSDNKKERRSKFPQGYAWRNKYALFGTNDSSSIQTLWGEARQMRLCQRRQHRQSRRKRSTKHSWSRMRAEFLRTCSRSTWMAGTARQRHSASM